MKSFVESLSIEDKKRLFSAGLQPLDFNPQGLYCKYAINRECEGSDLDPIRCSVVNMDNCLTYQIREHENEALAISSPLVDTVVMSAEDVTKDSKNYRSR